MVLIVPRTPLCHGHHCATDTARLRALIMPHNAANTPACTGGCSPARAPLLLGQGIATPHRAIFAPRTSTPRVPAPTLLDRPTRRPYAPRWMRFRLWLQATAEARRHPLQPERRQSRLPGHAQPAVRGPAALSRHRLTCEATSPGAPVATWCA